MTTTARRDCLGRLIVNRDWRDPVRRWLRHTPQPDWGQALCRKFPAHWWDGMNERSGVDKEVRAATARAVQICRGCPIVDGCLTYALEAGMDYLIWGGMEAKEREELRRRNRL